jgi:hypothetical protein
MLTATRIPSKPDSNETATPSFVLAGVIAEGMRRVRAAFAGNRLRLSDAAGELADPIDARQRQKSIEHHEGDRFGQGVPSEIQVGEDHDADALVWQQREYRRVSGRAAAVTEVAASSIGADDEPLTIRRLLYAGDGERVRYADARRAHLSRTPLRQHTRTAESAIPGKHRHEASQLFCAR